jgi:chromosome segregation ATPase
MDAREAQMRAEIRAEQLTQRLQLIDGKSGELQTKLDEMSAKYKEAHSEVVVLEEEKYTLTDDVETLEAELEEAQAQTKRYYEVVEEREAELRKLRDELAAAKQKIDRLAYEKELALLRELRLKHCDDEPRIVLGEASSAELVTYFGSDKFLADVDGIDIDTLENPVEKKQLLKTLVKCHGIVTRAQARLYRA